MNDEVRMVRDNLDHIPHFSLPPGYSIRWYEPGDANIWWQIQSRADKYNDITPDLFKRAFGSDEEQLHKRQCYVVDTQGIAIGTATAWYGNNHEGLDYGRVHWVAIVPDSQGLGLGKPLMTTVCERLAELGHKRAYLTTSTVRIPAINLYLKFGFTPQVNEQSELEAWNEVRDRLKYRINLKS